MEKPGGDLKRTQRIIPELYGLRVCLAYVTRPRRALGVVATRDGNQGPNPPQGGGDAHPTSSNAPPDLPGLHPPPVRGG